MRPALAKDLPLHHSCLDLYWSWQGFSFSMNVTCSRHPRRHPSPSATCRHGGVARARLGYGGSLDKSLQLQTQPHNRHSGPTVHFPDNSTLQWLAWQQKPSRWCNIKCCLKHAPWFLGKSNTRLIGTIMFKNPYLGMVASIIKSQPFFFLNDSKSKCQSSLQWDSD